MNVHWMQKVNCCSLVKCNAGIWVTHSSTTGEIANGQVLTSLSWYYSQAKERPDSITFEQDSNSGQLGKVGWIVFDGRLGHWLIEWNHRKNLLQWAVLVISMNNPFSGICRWPSSAVKATLNVERWTGWRWNRFQLSARERRLWYKISDLLELTITSALKSKPSTTSSSAAAATGDTLQYLALALCLLISKPRL